MLYFFYMKLPTTKRTIGRQCFTCFVQERCVLAMNKEPGNIDKQDKDTDNQYKDKPTMGVGQYLFEAGHQKVCNDENDECWDDKKEQFGPFVKCLNTGPNPIIFCQ